MSLTGCNRPLLWYPNADEASGIIHTIASVDICSIPFVDTFCHHGTFQHSSEWAAHLEKDAAQLAEMTYMKWALCIEQKLAKGC